MSHRNVPRHVVILGLMGAGKTTVGRELARRLGWRFSDSDQEIEGCTGQSARELKELRGADALHELEADHLLSALGSAEPTVIGAAASVVDLERCRQALEANPVVTIWLNVPVEELVARFTNDSHRPYYGASPVTFLPDQFRAREAAFRDVATVTIDAASRTPSEIVNAIVAAGPLAPLC